MYSKQKLFVRGTGDRYVRCAECNKLVMRNVTHKHKCLYKANKHYNEATISPRQQEFLANIGNV